MSKLFAPLVLTIATVFSGCAVMAAPARVEPPLPTYLLGSPQIRRELKIPHATALKIRHALDMIAESGRGGIVDGEQAAKQRAFARSVNPQALHREIAGYLSAAQKQRLREIGYQMAGPHIYGNAYLTQRIGLSKSQLQRLLAVDQKEGKRYARGVRALVEANRSWRGTLDPQRHRAKYAAYNRKFQRLGEIKNDSIARAVNHTLTPAQKARWKMLLGKPFNRRNLTRDIRIVPID